MLRDHKANVKKDLSHWSERELQHENDDNWEASGRRFVFIMDSQIMQKILCGHAGLSNEYFRPVFQRVTTNLLQLLSWNWLPPLDTADPVQWRAREFNARADWLCNKALDNQSSFTYVEPDIDFILGRNDI